MVLGFIFGIVFMVVRWWYRLVCFVVRVGMFFFF